MDAINFVNYLRNPGYLHQVTFQELNNLIEQYPYCQNLHYLALRKAQNEKHKDFDKKLELAATYSPNRKWLYKQLQEIHDPEAISDLIPSHSISDNDYVVDSLAELNVEFNANLETKEDMIAPNDNNKQIMDMEPLSKDMPTFDEKQPITKPDKEKSFSPEPEKTDFDFPAEESEDSPVSDLEVGERTFPDIPFEIYDPREDHAEEDVEEVLPEPDWNPTVEISPGDFSEQANHDDSFLENEPIASFDEEEEEIAEEEEEEIHFDEEMLEEEEKGDDQGSKVAPLPKTAFSSWRLVNPLKIQPTKNKKEADNKIEKKTVFEVTDLFKEKKDKKKKKKKEGTRRYAMKSLMEQEGAISETLAELLAEQGSKKKAIKMYKQLSKLYPNKSKAFAKRIKQLKK